MTAHEPFTEAQETAVRLYKELADFEKNGPSHIAWQVRLKLAGINRDNNWTMADVATAARLNYWPPVSRNSVSWKEEAL